MKTAKNSTNKNSFASKGSKTSARVPSKPSKHDFENLQKMMDFERDLDDKSKQDDKSKGVSTQSFDHRKPG